MFRSRIFWRLFGASGLLLLASIGLLGMLLAWRFEGHYRHQVNEKLRNRALMLREIIRDWPQASSSLLQERMGPLGQEINTRITLIDAGGKVLADSHEDPAHMENHLHRPEIEAARDTGW